MQGMLKFSGWIDAANERIGRWATWLVLVVVAISAGNAVMRYAIDWSSNGFLEIQWYLFSAIFLLCAGYVFLKNEHIRIDVIAGRLSARTQNWIDVFGIVVFLLPMVFLVMHSSWTVFVNAWVSGEGSPNPGGLIRWPVRLLLPVGCLLLALQGVSELIKRLGFLAGVAPNPLIKAGEASAEAELAEAIRQHQVAPEVADIVGMNRKMANDGTHPGDAK